MDGWQTTFLLLGCWSAAAVAGHLYQHRWPATESESRDATERWAALQLVCLGAGQAFLAGYYVVRGVELPVEDPSLVRWLFGMTPIVGTFYALAAGSLWIFTLLLGRTQWWRGTAAWIQAPITAALGWVAAVWPLVALEGSRESLFVLGALGAGASVMSWAASRHDPGR